MPRLTSHTTPQRNAATCAGCGKRIHQATSPMPMCKPCSSKGLRTQMYLAKWWERYPNKTPCEVDDFEYWQQCLEGQA